jgi:signal transduction histidine kinase
LLYLSRDATTVTFENTKVRVKNTADFMLPLLAQTLLVVMVVTALIMIILTLLTSHKISGPLFNISRTMKNVKEGDLRNHVHIRRNDQVRVLADNLNELIDVLRDKHLVLKKAADKLLTIAHEPLHKKEIDDELKKINEVANYFHT